METTEPTIVIVTGAARGIGLAIARAFAQSGATVHGLDIGEPAPGAAGGAIVHHGCDITDRASVARTIEAIVRAGGHVDVLVNNAAAVTRAVPITELAPEEWDKALAVNVTGTFNVTRAVLPAMRRGGSIVNLASTFSHVGSPGRVAYSATKGAILALTRSLALDLAPQGIRVNSVSPGSIATDRLVALFGSQAEAEAHLAPLHPIGHIGRPEDVADAVCFLASAKAGFVTGTDLVVDGGYTAR